RWLHCGLYVADRPALLFRRDGTLVPVPAAGSPVHRFRLPYARHAGFGTAACTRFRIDPDCRVNQIIQSVSNIAGPALGALAIGLMDIGYVLLIDIAGAVFAIVSLLFVTIPNPPPAAPEGKGVRQVLADIGAGIKG